MTQPARSSALHCVDLEQRLAKMIRVVLSDRAYPIARDDCDPRNQLSSTAMSLRIVAQRRLLAGDDLGQVRDGRGFEQLPQGDVEVECA